MLQVMSTPVLEAIPSHSIYLRLTTSTTPLPLYATCLPRPPSPPLSTLLPMFLFVLPNEGSSLAQGHIATIGGHPKIALFQPTHASVKLAKSWR